MKIDHKNLTRFKGFALTVVFSVPARHFLTFSIAGVNKDQKFFKLTTP